MRLRRAIFASAIPVRSDSAPIPPRRSKPPSLRATTLRTFLIPLGACALGACSQGGRAPDPQLGVTSSPRVIAGRAVPKGGGIYKVGKPYEVAGRWYVPREAADYDRSGVASWYGEAFHGRRTANGEIYDMYALTAGHPTLPLPSYAYVTNLDNGRTILVRINDRGPYVNNRLIDLSWRSAHELGYSRRGLARARVRYAGPAPLNGNDAAERQYLAAQPWYRGNLNVAQISGSDISTGAIGSSETAPSWSVAAYRQQSTTAAAAAPETRPATLGGPAPVDAGSFATLAEAERMRHELADVGPVEVEQVGLGPESSFRVRVRSRGPTSGGSIAGSGRIRAAVERGP
jgi:peptidoglycan lytic transglycosylase